MDSFAEAIISYFPCFAIPRREVPEGRYHFLRASSDPCRTRGCGHISRGFEYPRRILSLSFSVKKRYLSDILPADQAAMLPTGEM
jgi:hypothetical protein